MLKINGEKIINWVMDIGFLIAIFSAFFTDTSTLKGLIISCTMTIAAGIFMSTSIILDAIDKNQKRSSN